MSTAFTTGQLVCLQVDPSRQGSIIGVLPAIAGRTRYRVFHGPGEIREYSEDQLSQIRGETEADLVARGLANGSWLPADVFRARLTAARLSNALVDNLYALHAARIQFIPFQLRPLLRLLRADKPRILIADEVGVGKTIEAGLILKELEARGEIDRVLVVCPKALVTKWRAEMRRFDESFFVLTSEMLTHCLRETERDGVWPSQFRRAILPLELARRDENLRGIGGRRPKPGLLTITPSPRFSLLIVDEAHHLRNPDTGSHELAEFLSEQSDAALFLSATPVQIGSRNLFTLLNLLRPDLFIDETVFQSMVEPSRHLMAAMRYLRSRQPALDWARRAADSLSAAAMTYWGSHTLAQDRRFRDWHDRLRSGGSLDDADRIRCLRDLEECHPLAEIMNRTRRRDIGRFTMRDPQTVSVMFTPSQERFYEALIAFHREVLLLQHEPLIVRLITDMLERQAASCLPALAATIDTFLRTGRFAARDFTDDTDLDDAMLDLPPSLVADARALRNMAADMPPVDPKLDSLRQIVSHALDETGAGKVLIFSYFLHTLRYLERNLEGSRCRVATITGQMEDTDRERLRDRFRLPRTDPAAIDVLLSSDVGCEGLDYEFCDRLVNYDIPWNPMRIEQRIGRIDRFGQKSEKVLIFNFITPGTIEERVFFRCFERIGVFRDTVGDLEEILGDLVQDLTRDALDPALTPNQASLKAQQLADNALRLVEEQRRLEEDGASLLGLDQVLVDEVDELISSGRFVSPGDLRVMIHECLDDIGIAGRWTTEDRSPSILRFRLGRDGRSSLLGRVRALDRYDQSTIELTRWLEGDEPVFTLTFDQQTALEHREIAFVTPVHPLARLAIDHWQKSQASLVSHLRVVDSQVPAGRYLFACDLWESIGLQSELRLTGVALEIDRKQVEPIVSDSLVLLLGRSTLSPNRQVPTLEDIEMALYKLNEEAEENRRRALDQLHARNDLLASRRLGSVQTHYQNRIRRVAIEMSETTNQRIRRMKEAERDRLTRNYEEQVASIEKGRVADILAKRIAAGILTVSREANDAE